MPKPPPQNAPVCATWACLLLASVVAVCGALASPLDSALERGMALYEAERMAESLLAFEQAVETDAASPVARYGMGIVCNAVGWLDRAEREFEAALLALPAFPEAHTAMGGLMLRRGAFGEAERHYTTAVEQQPASVEGHLCLGRTYARQRRFAEARAAYARALRLAPDSGAVHRSIGEALAAQGEHEAAIASYEAALGVNPADIDGHCGVGMARLRLKRHQDAVAPLQRAVDLDPRNTSAWNALGRAYAASGQTRLAEEAMAQSAVLRAVDEKLEPHRRALDADPTDLAARYSLMKGLLRADRTDEASRECDRLLVFDPTHVAALDARVRIHLSQQEWQPGYVWAQRLARAKPDSAMAFLYLGMAAGAVGAVDDAIAAYRRAIGIDPGKAAGYHNLAWTLYRHGRSLDEAATLATQAVRLQPSAGYLDTLSRIHEARGDTTAALAAIDRAVAADPSNATYLTRRVTLRAAAGSSSP